jgi:hypothetical protein
MKLRGIGLLLVLALAGCTGAVERRGIGVEATGTVLAKDGAQPQLCRMVRQSRPPQCGGVPLRGFDFADVPGAESADDVVWVEATVRGTYRDGVLHVDAASRPVRPPEPPPTPEDELQRIWAVQQDPRAEVLARWAHEQPEYAGEWWEHDTTLVLAFTGDVERLDREARTRWTGDLRVERRRWRDADLHALQDRLTHDPRLRGRFQGAGSDIRTGVVELMVLIDDEETRAIVEEIRGPDAPPVVLDPFLRPVA